MKKYLLSFITLLFTAWAAPFHFSLFTLKAQAPQGNYHANTRFEQMGTELPTPNTTRTASGAPGKDFWQQRADYDIKAELDDENRSIKGTETITYFNYSPDELKFVWLQLDQNLFQKGSINALSQNSSVQTQMSSSAVKAIGSPSSVRTSISTDKEYGYKITSVRDAKTQQTLKYTINNTMMRIELPTPIRNGQSYAFQIDWNYNITEYYGRSGFEFFAKDGNANYFIAHWFPRMCVYDDVNGWMNKQFLGQGEFTLTFGNYKVAITVPNDHIVGATGELQNAAQVLTAEQMKRMEKAKTATRPVLIVSQEEAEKAEKGKPSGKKTWIYKAENVRDFAFASSRKFIWDAMQIDQAGKKVMCMSLYPKEGNPLWGQYSTMVVAHTIRSYSKYSIDYPYPVAYSCHSTAGGGMEYPMISFNGGRPEADGTYSEQVKYGMIGVIIHEVGHNFFPMIVNSDERQWSWMDEGLNTFVQYLAEKEWDRDYPARRGEPQAIVEYMKTDATQQVPIMSSSDNIMAFGPNAYAKPATGLNILRETIMGRELFDYAFKEYSRRWAFKNPTPADFFRTMEDASGVDLDWFWKGWFYGVEPANQDLTEVEWFAIDAQNPEINKAEGRKQAEDKRETMARKRDRAYIKESVVEKNPDMKDFYNTYDPYKVTEADKKKYEGYLASLGEDERKLVESGMNFYTIKVKNKGGLPMPVIIKMQYEDGTDSVARFPAEIWRLNDQDISKVILSKKKVVQWTLDPFREIADIDEEDNMFPRQPAKPTKFQMFKSQGFQRGPNPMREAMQNQQPKAGQQGGAKN
ncbi:MAG: M1 family peptidase [Runella slithyformis]|nr:MAG: M1 family peptidase [Runella slithyformis]TAE94115.1 MAG: M1 family peptidase [Runella slithyformis]TAF28945.1 MAG: M1 family peptidase [Runella slithyformis]TAF47997.1 MAG: M1 family peptidase [Runella slithyformis]